MLYDYLKRGTKAGAVGGLAYGLFVAFVGNALVAFAETFEGGHSHAPAVPAAATQAVSVAAGVAFGVLLGAVAFGVAYYFLEPAIPGAADTKRYVLAAAGFLTVSGAPWVLFPPQPPGVSQSLPTDARLLWYGAMMVTGAVASAAAVYAYRRASRAFPTPAAAVLALAPLALVPAVALLAPANTVTSPVPDAFASAFRAVTAVGQLGLWVVTASAHVWLGRRADDASHADREEAPDAQPLGAR
ncbi:CbtA family protein [Halobacterium hubeiense]|uniref:CbtA family protein n=1 Tax=Halobacterium hubeiense TaxID=1407499 RepID=A0A0U5CX47_9EURY|nr:CbtA family protein [Halobacterium hubeiense]CQH53164.1 CbtA family protein [Halobacterium hubeiense]